MGSVDPARYPRYAGCCSAALPWNVGPAGADTGAFGQESDVCTKDLREVGVRKSAIWLGLAAVIALVAGVARLIVAEQPAATKVRQAAVAGMFYPGDAATLQQTRNRALGGSAARP